MAGKPNGLSAIIFTRLNGPLTIYHRGMQKMTFEDLYKPKFPPYDHQLEVLTDSYLQKCWALFMEMGTGKSKIVIDNAFVLSKMDKLDSVVIVAKKGEYANWYYDLIKSHMPDDVSYDMYLFKSSGLNSKKGKRQFTDFIENKERDLKFIIVNVEGITSAAAEDCLSDFYKQSELGTMMVVDESTCVKTHSAARSKKVYYWASKSDYRRIMTGTAITQSPLDIWGQSLVLGKGLLEHGSFYSFRSQYAVMKTLFLGNRSVKVVDGYKNIAKLSDIISSFSSQVLKKDCLDLPEKIYTKLHVPMTKQQQKLYDDMKDQAIIELGDEEVSVDNALAQMSKLHQIACGQVKIDDNNYLSVENNRIGAMIEVLETHNGKAIIWANYRQTLQDVLSAVKEKFGDDSAVAYYGGVSDDDRVHAIEEFQNPDSNVRWFVANAQSAGYGLTLTAADLVVYYSNSFNLEHRLQSEDRAHRIGQTKAVTYVDIVAPDTVDEKIITALRKKKKLSDEVMKVPFAEWV